MESMQFNLESKKMNNIIYFKNFGVKKIKNHMYGVFRTYYTNSKELENTMITSGTSLGNACKKAKLLQIGYDFAKEIDCK